MDPEFRRTRSRQESGRRAAAEHLHRLARQLRRLDADPAAATFERVAAAAAETGEGPEARMRWRECRGRIGLDRFPGTAQDCLGDLTALGPALKTLRLLSRKGGVGKSTLAIHLAVLAQRAGLRALLLDMDPQRSAAAWWGAPGRRR